MRRPAVGAGRGGELQAQRCRPLSPAVAGPLPQWGCCSSGFPAALLGWLYAHAISRTSPPPPNRTACHLQTAAPTRVAARSMLQQDGTASTTQQQQQAGKVGSLGAASHQQQHLELGGLDGLEEEEQPQQQQQQQQPTTNSAAPSIDTLYLCDDKLHNSTIVDQLPQLRIAQVLDSNKPRSPQDVTLVTQLSFER